MQILADKNTIHSSLMSVTRKPTFINLSSSIAIAIEMNFRFDSVNATDEMVENSNLLQI